MLKFTELMHSLDRFKSLQAESDHIVDTDGSWIASMTRLLGIPPRKPKVYDANMLRQLRSEANTMCRICLMFRDGVVTLDEVDLLLHPLKSELNWPLGQKKAIDLSRTGMYVCRGTLSADAVVVASKFSRAPVCVPRDTWCRRSCSRI